MYRGYEPVLSLCQEAGLVKLGVCGFGRDEGDAGASKQNAMSFGRMCEAEKELDKEVSKLLAEAQRIDEEEDKAYVQAYNALAAVDGANKL